MFRLSEKLVYHWKEEINNQATAIWKKKFASESVVLKQ